jgi:hypothetical protein
MLFKILNKYSILTNDNFTICYKLSIELATIRKTFKFFYKKNYSYSPLKKIVN